MRTLRSPGPAATDVHHNFAQRWNEASERATGDGIWGHDSEDDLAFPERLSQAKGASLVQIQRNIHVGLYRNGRASPAAPSFQIANGESTIRDQYLTAIDAARRSIYIENQALSVSIILAGIKRAVAAWKPWCYCQPSRPPGSRPRDASSTIRAFSTCWQL